MRRGLSSSWPLALLGALAAAVGAAGGAESPPAAKGWRVTSATPAPEARQAAAADDKYFYAITNDKIATYDRATGKRIAVSSGEAHHLNSGFLDAGVLYCAHSNFPAKPEVSRIMALDTATMKLTTFHDFGGYGGSLTWCVKRGDEWWCTFALYGKDNARTFLVSLDRQWRQTGRWTYPPQVVGDLGDASISGGIWDGDSLLVIGHDKPVVYRVRLPASGTVLEYVETLAVPFPGQGIARDPVTGGLVGIHRQRKQVLLATPDQAR